MHLNHCVALGAILAYTFAESDISKTTKQIEKNVVDRNRTNDKVININSEVKKRDRVNNSDYLSYFDLIYTHQNSDSIKRLLDDFKMERRLTHFNLAEDTAQRDRVNNSDYLSHFDLTHTHQNSDSIKRSLDDFKMERRLTHFNLAEDMAHVYNKENKLDKYTHTSRPHPGGIGRNRNEIKKKKKKKEIPKLNVTLFNEVKDSSAAFYNDSKLYYVLRKQTVLLQKLLKIMDQEKRELRTANDDFAEIIAEISNKTTTEDDGIEKDNRITEPPTPPTTTEKTTLSTVVAVIDEMEVRAALRKDPYVKRILKMASKKRKQYLAMAEVFKNNFQS